jgi:hypothetical protein
VSAQTWIVKSGIGTDWGLIKRLIIDRQSRQISYVDLVVVHTGEVVRLPWDTFEIRSEEIRLRMSEAQASARSARVSELVASEAISMDVWP